MAKELCRKLPNKMYIGDDVNKSNEFVATNSLFGICYFKPRENKNITFKITNYHKKEWHLSEYVGVYEKATEIRYINKDKDYGDN